MPENGGDALGAPGQRKAKMSLVEILMFAAYATGLIGLQLISDFSIPNSGARNPLLGILALLCILVAASGTFLLVLKAAKSQKCPHVYFRTMGFWLMVAAYIVVLCVAITTALFTAILPLPAFIPVSFMSNLLLVGFGAGVLALVGCTIWLMQAGLRARRDFHRWLDTLDAGE